MARETFIAYKYSEAKDLRDKIIEKLGDDSRYYQGETAESPDMSGEKIDRIKNSLKDMIFGTSVTIVVISPNLKNSEWVDWEIQYSLKEYKRQSTTSKTNGIIGVIMKYNGGYDWLKSTGQNNDGCTIRSIDSSILYNIVNNNRYNLNIDNKYSCPNCKTFDQLTGSYIALVEEDRFLANPNHFIENAYDKSKDIASYDLSKER